MATALAVALLPAGGAGAGSRGATERVSVSSTGSQSTSAGGIPSPTMSDDGRFVVFHTRAEGLVPNDTNDREDAFVHDRSTGETVRISAPGGAQPNGPSLFPEISGDGRFVVFGSGARNLVPGDTNADPPSPTASPDAIGRDVYVWDRTTGAITREDVPTGGGEAFCVTANVRVFCGGGVALAEADISADGRWVALAANATNMVASDTNGQTDVFLRDRQANTTTRINNLNNGTQATGGASLEPDISADGRFVAFSSAATGTTANNVTTGNLVPTGTSRQVFVYDKNSNQSSIVSVVTGGATLGNGNSSLPSISADGRWVAFVSLATNLVPGDTNGESDVFLHDRQTGTTTRVSVGPGGVQGAGGSFFPRISGDGRFVSFDSPAANLVAGDSNAKSDAFVYDRTTGTTSLVSLTRTLAQGNDGSFFPALNYDGRYAAFGSEARNLVLGDSNDDPDVFVHDRTRPTPFSDGYRMVAGDGGIFSFNAPFYGSTGNIRLNKPIVGMASTPRNDGYWLVASDGGIFAFGNAKFFGSTGAQTLAQPIVGMASTPTGAGYWLVAADGGVFAFGDATFQGSTGALRLAKPIVGMASTPSGKGYYLVASDGGVFAFGDAVFRGSTGAIRLNQAIVGIGTAADGTGYFLVAADGGIFAFGSGAVFRGSTGALRLNAPIVGMAVNPSGGGYWLLARDGGVFAFGDAAFKGSMGGTRLNQAIVGGAAA